MNSVEAVHPAFDWPADSERLDEGSLASDLHASESGFEGFMQLQQFQSSELCIESHADVLAPTEHSSRYGHGTPELEVFINDDIRSLDDGCSMNEASIPPHLQDSRAQGWLQMAQFRRPIRPLVNPCHFGKQAAGPQSAAPMPSHRFLERQNAELSAELITAQAASRQLEARLDASRTLCDQLQRALVDAACPQVTQGPAPCPIRCCKMHRHGVEFVTARSVCRAGFSRLPSQFLRMQCIIIVCPLAAGSFGAQ